MLMYMCARLAPHHYNFTQSNISQKMRCSSRCVNTADLCSASIREICKDAKYCYSSH